MAGTKSGAVPRVIAAAILVAGFAASLIVNWPGHLEFDGINQLAEGRFGAYSNWHPPVMSWLLGLSDAISPQAAAFVALDTAIAFGAFLSLLWLVNRPSWAAVGAALITAALPQLFLFQAIVWKDILFADAALAGFVCLAHAGARWAHPRLRFALLGGAVVFIALAVLTRQNGFVILPCAAVALGWIAAPGWRRALRYGVGFFACVLVLALGINALLQLRATQALGAVEQMADLQLYDIAGMMQRDPHLRIAILEKDAPAMAHVLYAKGVKLYTPATIDPILDESGTGAYLVSSIDAVKRQWRALIWAHPADYLAVRAADFWWVFSSPHTDECMTYAVGVDGLPERMKQLALPKRYDDRDNWLDDDYAGPLTATPALSHPFFAMVGLACLVLLLRRRRPADLAMAALLAASMVYTLSYFAIALACEYRYLFVLDLAAIAAAFYIVADFRVRERSA